MTKVGRVVLNVYHFSNNSILPTTDFDFCTSFQTSGYSGAIFKSFEIMQEAETFLRLSGSSSSTSTSTASSCIPVANAVRAAATLNDNENANRGGKRPRLDAIGTTDVQKHATDDPSSTISKQNRNHRIIRITIHFDGGSRGNPGVAGAGAHVLVVEEGSSNTEAEYHVRKYCGVHCTNNYAEYSGLLSGLQEAKSYIVNLCKISFEETTEMPTIHLEIHGDSNLVIQQMLGVWQCKHDTIRPLFNQCNAIIREMNECIAVATKKIRGDGLGGNDCSPALSVGKSSIVPTFGHIRRNLNGVADSKFGLSYLPFCCVCNTWCLSLMDISLMQHSTSKRGHGRAPIMDYIHHHC